MTHSPSPFPGEGRGPETLAAHKATKTPSAFTRKVQAFQDRTGKIHDAQEPAIIADIQHCLAGGLAVVKDASLNITPGLARLVAERASDLEPLLSELIRLKMQKVMKPGVRRICGVTRRRYVETAILDAAIEQDATNAVG